MGGDEFSERYRDKLSDDLEEAFNNFRAHNESKNIFKAARTPAVFFGIAVIMYMLSGIFGLFGIYTLANSSNLLMGISLLTLALWAYIRYSGELSDVGCHLDMVADYVWENVSVRRAMQWVIFGLFGLWKKILRGKPGRKVMSCPIRMAAMGRLFGGGESDDEEEEEEDDHKNKKRIPSRGRTKGCGRRTGATTGHSVDKSRSRNRNCH